MADAPAKRATWADLEALPPNVRGELIGGVLYTRRCRDRVISGPSQASQVASGGPFDQGPQGPGGWWILVEPGIGLPALDVAEIAPDLGGWRRERMPELPDAQIQLAPDWVCEVLSPTTRQHDLRVKRPLYARAGVRWMWIVDLEARTLTASRLHEGSWLELGVFVDDDVARAEPFAEVEIPCAELGR